MGRQLRRDSVVGQEVARVLGRPGDRAVDGHPAGGRRQGGVDGGEEGGLAGAVAPHQRDDLAGRHPQAHTAQRDDAVPHHADPRARRRAPAASEPGGGGEVVGGRSGRAVARRGRAARRASRTDSGRGSQPSRTPSSTTGGRRRDAGHRDGGVERTGDPPRVDQQHGVGVVHDAFEPVLGDHDRRADVVHQAVQDRQHLLGRDGVEGRGGLVEHQHPGRGRPRPPRSPPAAAGRRTAPRPAGRAGRRCRAGRGSPRPGAARRAGRRRGRAARRAITDSTVPARAARSPGPGAPVRRAAAGRTQARAGRRRPPAPDRSAAASAGVAR